MKTTNINKNIFYSFMVFSVLTFTIPFITHANWTAPSANPPSGGTETPINVSGTIQTKSGAFVAGSLLTTGGAVVIGTTGIGTYTPAYKLDVNGDAIIRGWLRTTGTNGWYSETYGGGWFMSDTTWIRAYGNKGVYTAGQIRGDGGLCISTDCRTSWPSGSADVTLTSVINNGATTFSVPLFQGGIDLGNSDASGSDAAGIKAWNTINFYSTSAGYTSAANPGIQLNPRNGNATFKGDVTIDGSLGVNGKTIGAVQYDTTVGSILNETGCGPVSGSCALFDTTGGHRYCRNRSYMTGTVVEYSCNNSSCSATVMCIN